VVGKYTGLKDAYKSLIEALHHGGLANGVSVELDWVEAGGFENGGDPSGWRTRTPSWCQAASARGVGGQDRRGRFARERKVPFFGICFGMQMAVIEAARSQGVTEASSTEFGPTPIRWWAC
jgi:CTP synthase